MTHGGFAEKARIRRFFRGVFSGFMVKYKCLIIMIPFMKIFNVLKGINDHGSKPVKTENGNGFHVGRNAPDLRREV